MSSVCLAVWFASSYKIPSTNKQCCFRWGDGSAATMTINPHLEGGRTTPYDNYTRCPLAEWNFATNELS